MKPAVIIGLVGPSGSGKTTVCEHLRKRYGFVRIHTATPLKRALRSIFELPESATEGEEMSKPLACLGGVTMRDLAENIGSEMHRVAPLALPLTLDKRLKRMEKMDGRGGGPRIVVDGIRRVTEANVVRSRGGKILRLVGTDIDPAKPCDATQALVEHDHTLSRLDTPEAMLRDLDWVVRTYFLPDETESGDGRRAHH